MTRKFGLLAAAAATAFIQTPARRGPRDVKPATVAETAADTSAPAGDIVVTARRRQELIPKVPVVANVLGAEMHRERTDHRHPGVATKVPGLFVRIRSIRSAR